MTTLWRSNGAIGAAVALLLCAASGEAAARGSCQAASSDVASRGELNTVLANYGARVVAIGRVDAVSAGNGIRVLGIRVTPSAGDRYQIGDYAAILDWTRSGAKERLLEVRPLIGRYVPGVSEVFLKSKLTTNDPLRGLAKLGTVNVDYSSFALAIGSRAAAKGIVLAVRGTQPQPNGVILSNCASLHRDGSLGTGRVDGSLGTGKTDGSLGTGRADGSLGTGRTDGSLGTGRTDGSLGTGKTDGSLGTGWLSGSLGTGRIDGSLGTGKTDGSLGTGRTDGSLGTGRAEGSLGTGKIDGSLGTG